ncbi:50S ribosomal protein L20 [Patescibacteria group bacterium]|nr:50S ribosomal protein L20 [Patescibacteria group bacterium]
MARVKRGVRASKRRKKVLKAAKGFQGGRKSKFKAAKQATLKAGSYAYRDRKVRKREFRRLWITRLNAAVREEGLSYSVFIASLKKNKVDVDRKVLADIAFNYPEVFKKIIDKVK